MPTVHHRPAPDGFDGAMRTSGARAALAVTCVLVGVLSSCSTSTPAGGSATTGPSGPALKVCTDAPYEVFEFGDSAHLQGFDIDVTAAVASALDRPTEWIVTPLDQFGTALSDGTCDAAASALKRVPERTDLTFSEPYLVVDQALVVPDGSEIRSFADLAGRSIGVVADSDGADLARTTLPPGTAVSSFATWSELVAALRDGSIDAAIADAPLADRAALLDGGVVVAARETTGTTFALAVAPAATPLLAQIDGALSSVAEDGTLADLQTTWFGQPQPPTPGD